jgi:hypothetical protein
VETSCASHWAGLHLFGLISPLVFLLPVMLQVLTFDPSLVRTAVMDIIIVRPRSEEQRRLQLCAKPPRRPIAAQRASASSLPASGAKWRTVRLWRSSAGRLPSLRVAGRRIWPVREAPDHGSRARQTAPAGSLSRAGTLRPRAAAFWTSADTEARACARLR